MCKILNIESFGARKDCEEFDNSWALNKAICFAAETDDEVVLDFPKGTYMLNAAVEGERFIVKCQNARNITVRGNDSRLLIKNAFAGVFVFVNCENIVLSGFEIKYETAPWTQGEVLAADKESGTLTYCAEEDYDLFADSRYTNFAAPWGVVLNPQNLNMLRPDAPESFKFTEAERIGERTYKMGLEKPELVSGGVIKSGDKIVYTNREMSGSCVAAFHSKDITVRDMLVYECGDCLFVGAYLEGDIKIINYKTKLSGKNYVVSIADGVHIQGLRGRAIIENCSFEGLLDDCVNLYQYPGIVTEKISDLEYRVIHPETNIPRIGDTIAFYNPKTQEEKVRCRVTAIRSVNSCGTEAVITLDKSTDEIRAGKEAPYADTFCILNSMAPGSEIKNNHFRLCRRYGLLLKSRDTLVENNVFEDLGADAVNFAANVSNLRKEGPFSENVTIKNNVIKNVCYRNGRKYKNQWASGAAIGIYKYNKGIKIFDNTIEADTACKISYGSEEEGIHIR